MARAAPDCPCCAQPGRPVYEGLTDAEFGVPGSWTFRRCPSCVLWWTDPQPLPAEIPGLYARYYTHAEETGTSPRLVRLQDAAADRILPFTLGYGKRTLMGALLCMVPGLRGIAGATVLWIPARPGARLLDVGAGNGTFLRRMKERGWEVRGVEPDPEAARGARERLGVPVVAGTLDDLLASPDRYDVITLSHVIEHVADPAGLLRSAKTLLKPGGRIVVLTPNAESLGRRVLGRRWRGLEIPRHLSLFSRRSLGDVARKAGLSIRTLRCPTRSAMWMWTASRKGAWGSLVQGALFQAAEEVLSWVWSEAGEEILLVAD